MAFSLFSAPRKASDRIYRSNDDRLKIDGIHGACYKNLRRRLLLCRKISDRTGTPAPNKTPAISRPPQTEHIRRPSASENHIAVWEPLPVSTVPATLVCPRNPSLSAALRPPYVYYIPLYTIRSPLSSTCKRRLQTPVYQNSPAEFPPGCPEREENYMRER